MPDADRVDGRFADQRARLGEVDLRQLGAVLGERVERDADARADDAAEVLARRGDDVVGHRRAEVDRDAGPAELCVGGDRVDDPVGAELVRVVDPDRHPGLAAPGPTTAGS